MKTLSLTRNHRSRGRGEADGTPGPNSPPPHVGGYRPLRFWNVRTGLFAVAMSLATFDPVFGQPVITQQPQNQTQTGL
jgi:hypothetical protein